MKTTKGVERLISEHWPKLKQQAQNEDDPEKLIAILEEIDDLLFNLEMRVTARDRNMNSRATTDSRSDSRSASNKSVCRVPPDDQEIGSQ
jgi:hypothetical protein